MSEPGCLHQREPYLASHSSLGSAASMASSSEGTSTRLSFKFFCYSFPHIEEYHFEMHTSKPSAMPIMQPHQNKFRVFLLIAQLMVRKLFLGAHFKIHFCWLSSLDFSIRESPYLASDSSLGSVAFSGLIIWRNIHMTKFKVFLLQFSSHRIVSFWLRCTLQKNLLPCQLCSPHQNKFRVFLLIAQLMVRKLFLGAHFKMPFYCCPSLDVSIRESPILSFPFFTGFSSFSASSSGGTSTRLSLEFFCYSFSHIE